RVRHVARDGRAVAHAVRARRRARPAAGRARALARCAPAGRPVVSADDVVAAFGRVLNATEEAQPALDALAGDGDHGVTMVLGWRAVVAALEAVTPATPGEALRTAAEAFAGVGGSAGPLWGTALLRAARVVADDGDLAAAAQAAADGMCERGRCLEGERTVVDAMAPAARALAAGGDLTVAAAAAVE